MYIYLSLISVLQQVSVAEQTGLGMIWLYIKKTGFLATIATYEKQTRTGIYCISLLADCMPVTAGEIVPVYKISKLSSILASTTLCAQLPQI